MSRGMIGRSVVHFGSVGSTMEEAERLAEEGAEEGTVVVADHQSAGVGRGGRQWTAAAGSAVLCSVVLRPEVAVERLGLLSLVAGVATAEAIEAVSGMPTLLKWPNDVWLGDGWKVAGVLVRARDGDARRVVLGVGINVSAAIEDLPAGATSVAAASGISVSVATVLDRLLERLDVWYGRYLAEAGQPTLDGWRRRAALLGERVEVRDAAGVIRGTMIGIADDGALLIEAADGAVRRVVAGELSRGPRRAGA